MLILMCISVIILLLEEVQLQVNSSSLFLNIAYSDMLKLSNLFYDASNYTQEIFDSNGRVLSTWESQCSNTFRLYSSCDFQVNRTLSDSYLIRNQNFNTSSLLFPIIERSNKYSNLKLSALSEFDITMLCVADPVVNGFFDISFSSPLRQHINRMSINYFNGLSVGVSNSICNKCKLKDPRVSPEVIRSLVPKKNCIVIVETSDITNKIKGLITQLFEQILALITEEDYFIILTFNDKEEILAPLSVSDTDANFVKKSLYDNDELVKYLESFNFEGGANILRPLSLANDILTNSIKSGETNPEADFLVISILGSEFPSFIVISEKWHLLALSLKDYYKGSNSENIRYFSYLLTEKGNESSYNNAIKMLKNLTDIYSGHHAILTTDLMETEYSTIDLFTTMINSRNKNPNKESMSITKTINEDKSETLKSLMLLYSSLTSKVLGFIIIEYNLQSLSLVLSNSEFSQLEATLKNIYINSEVSVQQAKLSYSIENDELNEIVLSKIQFKNYPPQLKLLSLCASKIGLIHAIDETLEVIQLCPSGSTVEYAYFGMIPIIILLIISTYYLSKRIKEWTSNYLIKKEANPNWTDFYSEKQAIITQTPTNANGFENQATV